MCHGKHFIVFYLFRENNFLYHSSSIWSYVNPRSFIQTISSRFSYLFLSYYSFCMGYSSRFLWLSLNLYWMCESFIDSFSSSNIPFDFLTIFFHKLPFILSATHLPVPSSLYNFVYCVFFFFVFYCSLSLNCVLFLLLLFLFCCVF